MILIKAKEDDKKTWTYAKQIRTDSLKHYLEEKQHVLTPDYELH